MIIFVEGQIGSGKSTLLHNLETYFNKSDKSIVFVQEPVDSWVSELNDDGENILQKFYADGSRWAFSFQFMALVTRMKALKDAMLKHPDSIYVVERSIYSDNRVFATLAYENKLMNKLEWGIYNKLFHELSSLFDEYKHAFIYVRVGVDVSLKRIEKRGRPEEATITSTYLEQLHDKHEKWLMMLPETSGIDLFITDGESLEDVVKFILSY
jgi:deoxyadenosine/deoxycytidine kinase